MQVHPAVVRVRVSGGMGSGVLLSVGKNAGWVVTNYHVVNGADGSVVVDFPHGRSYPAAIGRTDRFLDLAWLKIHNPGVRPMVVAENGPKRNEQCWIAGYGPENRFMYQTGRMTGYLSSSRGQADLMQITGCEARQGDSGGPILNARGQLVGILNKAGHGFTVGCRTGPLRKFLRWVFVPSPSAPSPGPSLITAGNSPSTPPSIAPGPVQPSRIDDRFDDLKAGLANLQLQLVKLGKNLDKPGLAGKNGRDGEDGQAGAPATFSDKLKDKIKGVASAAASAVVEKQSAEFGGVNWGVVLASFLGIGGPAGVGIGIAGWLISRRVRRRVKKRIGASKQTPVVVPPPPTPETSKPDVFRDYAQQQSDLYSTTGGRDALRDQTAGRIYDQELQKMLSGEHADIFYRFRDAVERNVDRIFTKNAQRTSL